MTLSTICLALLFAQPPAAPDPGDPVCEVHTRKFEIPLVVDPERKNEMKELQLFESWDKGKTWKRVGRVKPDKHAFHVKVARDGEVWYTVRVIDRKGVGEPVDLSKSVGQKLLIKTDKK